MPQLPPGQSLLVRVSFTDEDQWRAVLASITGDSSDGHYLTVVDDRSWEGAETSVIGDALRASERSYALIADDESMTSADHRLLVLSLSVDSDDVESLRVAASQASPVSDNLAIANLSLSDFAAAADADGVYRGQPEYTPPETLTKTELLALAEHNTSTPGLAQFHQEVHDLDPDRLVAVNRWDLAELHERVLNTDFRHSRTTGYDDFLAVTARGGQAETMTVNVARGYWQVIIDRGAGECLAAMKVAPLGKQ